MGTAVFGARRQPAARGATALPGRGVNLAGIKRIIELTNQVDALQARIKELTEELAQTRASQRRDLAVVPKSTAVVVWQPRRGR